MGMLAVGSNIWMQWASIKFSTFKCISWHCLCTLLVICSLKSPKKLFKACNGKTGIVKLPLTGFGAFCIPSHADILLDMTGMEGPVMLQ